LIIHRITSNKDKSYKADGNNEIYNKDPKSNLEATPGGISDLNNASNVASVTSSRSTIRRYGKNKYRNTTMLR